LPLTSNERLDFFGGAVNTAARLLGFSHGGDVVISDEVMAEITAANLRFNLLESLESQLRGLPDALCVHRIERSLALPHKQ
jgi:class 3 adenylate cyclase